MIKTENCNVVYGSMDDMYRDEGLKYRFAIFRDIAIKDDPKNDMFFLRLKPCEMMVSGESIQGFVLLSLNACWESEYETLFNVVDIEFDEFFAFAELNGVNEPGEKETELQTQIRQLLEGGFSSFYNELKKDVIGQDEPLGKVAVFIWKYLESILNETDNNMAFLICAPSGTGKTETRRQIQRVLRKHGITDNLLPIMDANAASLTPSGFKGENLTELFYPIMHSEKELNKDYALVWVDEIDKRVIPTMDFDRNVNEEVTAEMLRCIEGCILRHYKEKDKMIDTSHCCFIFSGSFNKIRNKKRKKQEEKHKFVRNPIGFLPMEEQAEVEDEKYEEDEPITREDLLSEGISPEFIGRLMTIISYRKLSKKDVQLVTDNIANSLSFTYGNQIVVTNEGYEWLYEKYKDSRMGCRTLRNELFDKIASAVFRLQMEERPSSDVILFKNEEVQIVSREEYDAMDIDVSA